MPMRILAARTPAWAATVAQAGQLIRGPGFQPLKRSSTRTVAGFVTVNGARVFLKCVEERGWLRGWIRRVWGSRPRRALLGAAMLKARGFACPEPLAAAEAIAIGAVRQSYLISEALEGARILSDVALAGGRRNFRARCRLSEAVAREIRRLHNAGLYTRDLQETNLMLSGDDGTGWQIHFVDLEDFRRMRTVSEQRRMLNLVHLDRSIGRFLPRTQRLRFLYNYLGGRPGRRETRQVLQRYFKMRLGAERRARSRQRRIPAQPIGAPHDPPSRRSERRSSLSQAGDSRTGDHGADSSQA